VHDPLSVSDLVQDELWQRIESGYDVSGIAAELGATAAEDRDRLEALYQELINTERRSDWAYQEPDSLDDILDAMPTGRRPGLAAVDRPSTSSGRIWPAELADRILGGWLGRIAGCNLGKPIENGDFWTPGRIRAYLKLAEAYPLRDYIPALDPMPEGFQLNPSWTETTRGRVHGSARDDDIDYSILALWLLEQYGFELSPSLVANAWLALLPYLRVFTAERAVLVSLLHNVPVASVGETRNPYREWIGALIRADVCGWVFPGQPGTAARLVYADASLSHRCNGIYAAMWTAALVSSACVAATVQEAVEQSLDYVPSGSRLAEALSIVHDLYPERLQLGSGSRDDSSPLRALQLGALDQQRLPDHGRTALGNGDYAATVGSVVQGGWDTLERRNAGSVVGTVLGAAKLPQHHRAAA
jgi:ADP-ribosylglycohydrolase